MSRVRIVANRIPNVKARIGPACARRLGNGARHLRRDLKAQLDGGKLPIHSDTKALAESLFVQDPQGSDYNERVLAAGVAYLSNDSRWIEDVRATTAPDAYDKEHFAARVAPEEPLQQAPDKVRASVGTMLAYGHWWQFGHQNRFTQRDEAPRDWMDGPSTQWAKDHLADEFKDLLK